MKTLIIYHNPCSDGMASACIAKRHIQEAILFPTNYGEDLPSDDLVKDANLYLLDFSYKYDQVKHLASLAKKIVIIDHHKTAEQELDNIDKRLGEEPDGPFLCNVECIFDMNKSGAVLTWEYFFPKDEVPGIIKHIQDRDLWELKMPYTEEITAKLSSIGYSFEEWEYWLFVAPFGTIVSQGQSILNYQDVCISLLKKMVMYRDVYGYKEIPIVNCATKSLQSKLIGDIAKGHPFAIGWYYDGAYNLSFRSDKDGIDVSELAKSLGGGGHKHASGAIVRVFNYKR